MTSLLDELQSILGRLRYVRSGDIILSEDHNTQNDALYKIKEILEDLYARVSELEQAPTPTVEEPLSPELGAQFFYKLSTVRVETSSYAAPVDDTESVLTFTLSKDSWVLIIYNASSRHGSVEDGAGKYGLINVDGIDIEESRAGTNAYGDNYADSFTCIWTGILKAGTHTVKGRFAMNSTTGKVGIDQRQMIVLALPLDITKLYTSVVGVLTPIDEKYYMLRGFNALKPLAGLGIAPYGVSLTKTTKTYSTTPITDILYYLYITEQMGSSNVLAIYVANAMYGNDEDIYGKYGLINIDGVDYEESRGDQSQGYGGGFENSITSVWAGQLGTGVHFIKGRIATNDPSSLAQVDQRQIAAFVVPKEFPFFYKLATTTVTTTRTTPVDDPYAEINFTLDEDSYVLVIYNASAKYGSGEHYSGKYCLINIDGEDREESRAEQSTWDTGYANSVTCVWAGLLGAGSHTVKGRFAVNEAGGQAVIDVRQLVVLAIPLSYIL